MASPAAVMVLTPPGAVWSVVPRRRETPMIYRDGRPVAGPPPRAALRAAEKFIPIVCTHRCVDLVVDVHAPA